MYICPVCGKRSEDARGWVIGQRYCAPRGELVIRCPDHLIGCDGLDARDLIE